MFAALFCLQALLSSPNRDWQQDLRYRITATLDEPTGVLGGGLVLRYLNRSPDTLRTIAFHLYLNAFRPGSRWAAADSTMGVRRFNHLRDPEFGFNHVRDVRIDGVNVVAVWPFAPDSTVVRFDLPRPLVPGDSAEVAMAWDARPSTLPRRQGHGGRHFDFAQWYPRVVAYDGSGWNEHPLYPTGEFYGEFATFLVQLDLPADQVVGATGVPICGDPGWEQARRPRGGKVTFQRTFYRDARDPEARVFIADGGRCPGSTPGRKVVTWYAEDVHHFALVADPEFRYEEGDVFERPVRILYRPGSERTWGAGLASRRTETALVWLDEIFGPYPWPQITIAERLEEGGSGFPMMVMNGGDGASAQELVLHEVGHNYLMGILANNEWREGWLDEGLTSFQTTWFFESLGKPGDYRALEREVLDWDLDRLSTPIARPGEQFHDLADYTGMTYRRAELFFHQLRHLVGDGRMRELLRTYYARYRFHHVDEARFQAVAEEVAGLDLSPLFRQWLHQTVRYDYAVRRARREAVGDSLWRTTVTVRARSPGLFPADVWVYGERDSAKTRLVARARDETVTVVTMSKPRRVAVDPAAISHDWNMLNNQRGFGVLPARRPTERYFGGWFSQRERRDRLTSGISPTGWFNDVGGWTLGFRIRTDYLGRFAADELWLNAATGWSGKPKREVNGRIVIRDPVALVVPGLDHWYEAGTIEGRSVLGLGFAKRDPRVLAEPGPASWGFDLRWVAVHDSGLGYLDSKHWSDAATLELTGSLALREPSWHLTVLATGGTVTGAGPGIERQKYARLALTAAAQRDLGSLRLRARVFAGAVVGSDSVPRQRRIFLAGADPYERLGSPFLRSRGALLARAGVHYHEPGGLNLRGLDPGIAATQGYGINLELERALLDRPGRGIFRRAAIVGFGDGALANGDLDRPPGEALRTVADAGVGVRFDHRIGDTPFQTRLDLPLWVSRSGLAQDRGPARALGWRWTFSFRPSW